MPSRNTVKQYLENGLYHIYNRGVEKRDIFLDDQDYNVFLHLLKFYLSPIKSEKHPLSELTGFNPVRVRPLANLGEEVELLCYCLMPNHFHLLIKQKTQDGMKKLLRRLLTTYSMYFNRRYDRVGHLFQGIYKAALIANDSYLLHLSRYIHLNPREMTRFNLVSYPYSSYAYYLGEKKAGWLNTDFILSYFKEAKDPELKDINSYKEFVESFAQDPKEIIGALTLE